MEYPVLTGALIWIEGGVTRGLFGRNANAMDFLFIVTLVNALLAALILWMMRGAGLDVRRQWGWAMAPPSGGGLKGGMSGLRMTSSHQYRKSSAVKGEPSDQR